ncbi:MAG TPA: hypothetical protein VM734_07095 [Kofleriaceae bacterium]|jgi:hypothetical protein|nr:hypothetical protein [Kofleriaceae bacterium]
MPRSLPIAAAALAAAAGACVETLPPLDETTSLRVELLSPVDPGTREARLDDTVRTAQIRVTAIDAQGQVDTDFQFATQVYVQFLGTLTPELGRNMPLATVALTDGVSAPTTIELPPVFGPTVLWVEDGGPEGSYATGTSSTLWFRDPYIADIQTPADEEAIDALSASPLELKQVNVSASRHGDRGRLVVNGTYAQGYTVSDVACADAAGTPPCVAGPYDHLLIFSFSRPKDEHGRNIVTGQVIDGFAGGVQEFNGLTEIGFPQSFVDGEPVVDEARIPEPVVVQPSWLSTEKIQFERNEAGLIAVDGATVCPLDDDYATYKQWKLDLGNGCRNAVNVITAGVVADFDPGAHVGRTLPRVVGVLRPLSIENFNVWILYPRAGSDLSL